MQEETPRDGDTRWLSLLSVLSRDLNVSRQKIEETLGVVLKNLVEKLSIDAAAVWVVEKETRFMRIEASAGLSDRYVRFFNKTDRIPVGKGLVGGVMERNQSLSIKNPGEYSVGSSRWSEMLVEEGMISVFATPIIVNGETIGVFDAYYKSEHDFTAAERLFLEVLANQIAVVIANREQYQTIAETATLLKNQVENMVNVQRVTQLLNLYLYESLDISLSYVADYFKKKFGVKSVAVFRGEPGKPDLPLVASNGLSRRALKFFEDHVPQAERGTLIGLAYSTSEPQVSSRVFTDDRIAKEWGIAMSIEHQEAMGAFPLIVQGRTIGVLATFYDHLHEFDSEELPVLTTFAQFLAVALENSMTFETLASERKKMKSMVDSIEDGLLVYDLSGRIIDANPRALKLFSASRASFVGKHPKEFGPDTLLLPIGQISQMTLSEGETKEISFLEPTNKTLHITALPLRDEAGEPIGSMRVIHDVSQEKVVERLKSNFVATASHQLRTPLAGVKWGLSSLLSGHGGALDGAQKELLNKIAVANDNVINLINEILNVNRIEEGLFEYRFTLGSVSDIIDELIEDFQVNIEERKLTIVREYAGEDSPPVMRDREKLSLAIRNLMDNAVKYTPSGGTITFRLHPEDGFLRISVQDTGIGIPAKDRELLFNKFYRAPNAVQFQTEGSGLGLFFVKSIVDKHNGSLSFESEEGKGSTFTISLPLDRAHMPITHT